MTTHTIRLRRPWDKTLVGSDVVTRVDVPEPPGEEADRVSTFQYVRRFNRPTGLVQTSVVRLVISGWSGQLVSIKVNGHDLDPDLNSLDFDVTPFMESQNQIVLQLTGSDEAPASLTGEVSLAIS